MIYEVVLNNANGLAQQWFCCDCQPVQSKMIISLSLRTWFQRSVVTMHWVIVYLLSGQRGEQLIAILQDRGSWVYCCIYIYIFIFTPKCLIQLLGQAARNMVIQEDAILHSEDVSNENCLIYVPVIPLCITRCQHSALTIFLLAEFKKNVHYHHPLTISVSH